MTELYELLEVVGKLNEEFKSKKDFNVFEAIRFRNQEIMHSKLIGTLLNPKGQHKKGDAFLKLFLKLTGFSDFNIDSVTIEIERQAEKRWIDITVENEDEILIIENKIEAKDQPAQLEDYYKFCKNKNKKVEVLYLTRYGNYPSDYSLGATLKREDIKLISYEKHIIPWIYECSRDKEVKGRLKYSLEMYHEILQTVINRSHYMNEIFEELKKDKSKLKLAIDIASTLQGRNYIKEFPKVKDYLNDRISDILGHQLSGFYREEIDESFCLEIEEFEEWWGIRIFDSEVYATNDKDLSYHLFNPRDITDQKLISLIFEDNDFVDEWLKELFEKIKTSIK